MTRAPEVTGPPEGSLEWRASLALKILAGINLAGLVLATIPALVPASELQAFAFNVASGALAVVYVAVARAIDRRRPWAGSAIRPMLLLLLGWGVFAFATAIAAGELRIPFTALVAGWALLRPPDHSPLPTLNGRGRAVLAASVLLIAAELAGQPVFGWGGYFDVHDGDLSASLTVDCPEPGGPPPERIVITYAWTWSQTTLLANADDEVVIGWDGSDGEGHPLYVFDDASEAGEGIYLASAGRVSAAMAKEAAGEWRGSLRWAIDLSAIGIRPGRVEIVLMRAREQPADPQPLTIGASYIHVGVWRNDTPTVTCSW